MKTQPKCVTAAVKMFWNFGNSMEENKEKLCLSFVCLFSFCINIHTVFALLQHWYKSMGICIIKEEKKSTVN
jgi:hypothetical protein